jgi:branched-subunit amino acid aminotransferase/4-amino-4-deoxychorismate lyase
MSYVNNNGVLIPADSYSLKAGNRAHLYGDGLFESIRLVNGYAINVDNHVKRLLAGMKALRMNIPAGYTEEHFETEIKTLIEQNNISEGGHVRLSVDRKPGGKFLPLTNDVEYFLEAYPLPNNKFILNEEGYKIDQYEDIKKTINELSAFKTKNALIYIMAKLTAQEKGLDDLLIQNDKMGIIEGGSSNLFVVSNGVLYTPSLDLGCLGGTMRMQIINLALDQNIKVYECNISPQNLLVADEVFLTNATRGLIWVGSYRTKEYTNEMAIRLTQNLNEKWRAR